MLSKNNKILIGCLALLLVMSVGYALFSDTITINGTATAKGEFDITATCQTGIPSMFGTTSSLGLGGAEGGYKNDTCIVNDNNVVLNTEFLYPGAKRAFTVKMTNTGTIDASVNTNEFTYSNELCVADDEKGTNKECVKEIKGSGNAPRVGNFSGYVWTTVLGMEDPNGNILSEREMLNFLDQSTGDFILKSGYSVYYALSLGIGHLSSDADTGGNMFIDYNVLYEIPFKQA